VDPQYLTLAREFEPAKAAKSLLDSDFVMDNGLIQVREDGGYIGRHNPMVLAKLNWTYFPYPFFHFNDSDITLFTRRDETVESVDLRPLPVLDMHMNGYDDHAFTFIQKGNDLFNFTKRTTMLKGVRFVNVSITVESHEDISVDWVRFVLHTKGEVILRNDTVGLFDEGTKALGQIIFAENQPKVYVITSENPSGLELLYNFQGKSKGEIQILMGVFSVTDDLTVYQNPETKFAYLNQLLIDNVNFPQKKISDLPLDFFDYRAALQEYGISYIACRDSELIPKFANDPAFSLVFINDDVAIFMVKKRFN
jgi:hypothetical protein